jgi:glycosyltransferase involved in cell wall biosynthesis
VGRRAAIILTPRLPWPLDDGGRIAAWQTVWAAAQSYDVTLLSFVPAGTEREPVPRAFGDLGVTVGRIAFRPPHGAKAAVRGLFGRWPYTVARYQDSSFEAALRERVAVLTPAFVMANNLHMAPYQASAGGVPFVLREQNVEHVFLRRFAAARGLTPIGLYARAQAGRLQRAEAELCRSAALTLAIQEGEAETLRRLAPGARVETLPIGIDFRRFPPRQPAARPVLLLPGAFGWAPNTDGALRFLAEGWPRLRARLPEATLRIVGKDAPPRLREAARRSGAELVPSVPSMPEEYARATALVVPLWYGGGSRVKIVEGLAAGIPVVSTSIGAEGLGLTGGVHYAEGETAAELADRAAEVLRDRELGERLAQEGRSFAEARWSLEAVSRLQNRLVAQVAR